MTIKRLVLLAVLAAVALAGLYLWLMLSWSYSDGERAGILQKFSRKGWICKTHEGELAVSIGPGVTPIIWYFSARNADAISELHAMAGKRVVLRYTEHRGLPSCFGETTYFVNRVRLAD